MIPFSLFNFRYQLENSEISLFGGFSHIWVIWWVKIGPNWGKTGPILHKLLENAYKSIYSNMGRKVFIHLLWHANLII